MRTQLRFDRDVENAGIPSGTIIETITDGMFHPSLNTKMDKLEAQKANLETQMRGTFALTAIQPLGALSRQGGKPENRP